MADVEALQLRIVGDATSAEQSINSLIGTLDRLQNAVKGGSGLNSLSTSLQKISTAVNSLGGAGQKLTDLANGLAAVSNVSKAKISSNIANQLTAINTAIRDAATTDYGSLSRLSTALQPLASLGKGGLGTLISQLKNLPTVAAELNKVDIASFTAKINQLATAMRPLANEMQKVASGFASFPTTIQKFTTASSRVPVVNNASALSFALLYGKIRMVYFVFRRIARVFASWINTSNKYIEDMNLFTVSMGEYAEAAKQYADEVSEVMGIDPGEWMRNQGVFMTLATGFGVATERAAKMSEQLTQLGYDISSFYNITTEEAMTKLQSGLSGELEPLRRIGYDLSQARLQATAASLGIDKLVTSMTQAEKAELRYYAIMSQVTVVQGDMARTLTAPANQLRVLKAQATMAARALGDLFIPALNAILPVAIAALKVITMLAQAIASLFGVELKVDFSSVGTAASGASGAVGDMADDLDGAAGSAKKLQKILLGIDELNVLPDPSSGGGGGASAGGGGGGFDFALPEYDFLDGAVKTRVDEIVEKIKEWLGISDEIDTWSEFFETRLGRILSVVGLIGGALALWKLSTGFMAALTTLTTLLKSPTYSIALGLILSITGFTLSFTGMKSAIEKGLDGLNFAEIVGGGLLGGGGAAILGGKIATWISTAFAGSAVDLAITQAGINLGVGTAGAAGAAIAGALSAVIVGIPAYFVGIYDAIKNGIDWLSGILIGAGATAGGAGIGAIVGMLGGPIGAGIGALIGAAIGLITDGVLLIVQNWDAIAAWFTNAFAAIGRFFSNLWADIKEIWGVVSSWFYTKVIQPVMGFFSGLWASVSEFFANMWADIVAIASTIAEWFNTNVIQPVVGFFSGLWSGIVTVFTNCWQGIVTVFTPAVEWFSALFWSVYQTIADIFYNIGVLATGCWEIIKAAWKVASDWFNSSVIQPVCNFFTELWEGVTQLASDAWEGIKTVYSAVTTWFDTTIIQPVSNFFTGLWDGIKSGATAAWTGIQNVATNAWNGIKSVYSTVTSWINTTIIQPVGNFFSNLWNGFLTGAKNAWSGVKSVFSTVADFFRDTFEKAWAGIVKVFSIGGEIFTNIKNGIVSAFKSVVNGLIRGINNVVAVPFRGINTALSAIRNISILGLTPFTNLRSISIPSIPYLASGGVLDAGQLFVAREAGPELVMNAGRKTAVMNNDQIVESVSQGVYRAFMQAMGESNGSQVVEAKVNDKVLFEVIVNRNRQETMRTGYSPLLGGV